MLTHLSGSASRRAVDITRIAGVRVRLFCFPYAGGNASAFRSWPTAFPAEIQVCPVHLPGRERRFREPSPTQLVPLAAALHEELQPYFDVPCALFGHSMGAAIAYELARLMEQTASPPIYLCVSGRRAPQRLPDTELMHKLPDDELVAKLREAHYGSALTPADERKFLNQRLHLRPAATGASRIRTQFAEPLFTLLAAAGIVLVISRANLGNLLLARATARIREISVRLALGASRGRVIRQLLTESMLLAFLGGIAGLGAAFYLRSGLVRLVSPSIELPGAPDVRVLGFAFVLTLAVGAMLGLLPAVRTTKAEAAVGLREQGRGAPGRPCGAAWAGWSSSRSRPGRLESGRRWERGTARR